MERVKKNQENISSASCFIHLGLSQRTCPVYSLLANLFPPCENKIDFQETFVIYAISPRIISDDFQKLPLPNFVLSCNSLLIFPDVTNTYI